MVEWAQQLMERMGYLGVLLLMVLENVFPPIPSEIVMPFAGFTAARGEMTFIGVCIAGTAGSVMGALPLYYLGRTVGAKRVGQWADRWGAWLTVSGADIDRAMGWFESHGRTAVLVGRLVPGVRSLISIPAGASAMPMAPFLLYTTLGSAVWVTALAFAGRQLGKNWERVETWMKPVGWVLLAAAIVWAAVTIYRRRRQRRAGA